MNQILAEFKNLDVARRLTYKTYHFTKGSFWRFLFGQAVYMHTNTIKRIYDATEYCHIEWGGPQENLTSFSSAYSLAVLGTWYGEQICTSI
jgi:hypothetical protein